jgi:hypothetical protein
MKANWFEKTRSVALLSLAVIFARSPSRADTVLFYGTPGEAAVAQMTLDLKSVLQELPQAMADKRAFEGEIIRTRNQVRQAFSSNQRDLQAEAHFVHLLDEKDFYYLPFYMNQLGLRGPAKAMDDLTGGKLDGGIRPEAEYSFNAWAIAMKNAMTKFISEGQAGTEKAIQETQPLYINYIVARNEAELNAVTNGRAEFMIPDPTPRQFADTYADKILKPALQEGRPWNGPTLTPQSIEDLRQAVFEYESIKLDPEKIAKYLTGYNYYVVEAFRKTAEQAQAQAASDPTGYQAVLEKAYSDAFVAEMARKGVPGMSPPSREAQLVQLKYASDPVVFNHLQQLDPHKQYLVFRPSVKDMIRQKSDGAPAKK